MKLYATVENEKGKREGIGGNEYLDIDIRVGNQILRSLTVRRMEDAISEGWGLFDENDNLLRYLAVKKTDEKQKGEKRPQYLNTETSEVEYDEDR